MIEAKVVFDGNDLIIGKYTIYRSACTGYGIYNMDKGFDTLEQAVKYCMEN